MFHTAAFKLAAWYLLLVMSISIGFSAVLYRTSELELSRTLRSQFPIDNRLLPPGFIDIEQFENQQIDNSLDHFRFNLILFNLAVLLLGGAASYLLALRTLRPIELALEGQTRFTADASHELRTPLAVMQTEIEVALREKNLTQPQAVELLQSNLEEVVRLRALADGLLKLARTDSAELSIKEVQLDNLIREAAAHTSKAASNKAINIATELDPIKIPGDYQTLTELITILLDNAIKYSEPNTTVRVRAHKSNGQAVITVTDQGRGIKSTDLPHIFERFYRADSSRSKDHVAGYGLGLSIARKIVDAHSGQIEATSVIGEGSTFVIKLPLSRAIEA